MFLSRKKVECLLWVWGEVPSQVEEFKYLRILFASDGRREQETDRWIGAASAVVQTLYRSSVGKTELSQKARLSVYRSIFVPTLTYGHELWVVTEKMRFQIQVVEMGFLHRVARVSLRDTLAGW